MRRSWIIGGWGIALLAAALLPIWSLADKISRNPLGKYVSSDGSWTPHTYWQFFAWWLPIALPVTLLSLACMVTNRPRDPL